MVAGRFKVLSDATRLRILQSLEEGRKSVTEITEEVESTQPNVSKHLKTLQEAGLVGREQEGNVVYYSIADDQVFALCDLVCASLEEHIERQAGALPGRGVGRES